MIIDYVVKNVSFGKQLVVILFINSIVLGYFIFLKTYIPAIIYIISALICVVFLSNGLRRIKHYKDLKDLSEIEKKYYYNEVHGVIICYFCVAVIPLIMILVYAFKISFSDSIDNILDIQ